MIVRLTFTRSISWLVIKSTPVSLIVLVGFCVGLPDLLESSGLLFDIRANGIEINEQKDFVNITSNYHHVSVKCLENVKLTHYQKQNDII